MEAVTALLDPNIQFVNLACGTKAGKTKFASIMMCYFAWQAPKNAVLRWVAPVYKQVKIGWRDMQAMCINVPVEFKKGDLEAHFPGGAVVEFRSGEKPELLAGEGVHSLCVIDEAAKCKEDVWYECETTFTQTKPKVLCTSTPRGRNWFYAKYNRGQDPLVEDEWSLQVPTAANPFIDLEELAKIKSRRPELLWQQEYEASFVDDLDICFPGFRDVLHENLEQTFDRRKRYVGGLDVGKHKSYTVLTIFERPLKDGDPLILRKLCRFQCRTWPEIRARCIRETASYHAEVLVDATGVGDPFFDDIRRDLRNHQTRARFTPFLFTNKSKEEIIENLQVSIEKNKIWLMDDPVLINEFNNFTYEHDHNSRLTKFRAAEGMTDDIVCSVALGAWAGRHRMRKTLLTHNLWEHV